MNRQLRLVLALLCTVPHLSACAASVTYSAEPIEARLIDAETKRPVEGAVVVAHWVLEGGLHPDRVGELMVMETVTDPQGKVQFPAWGPIRHWGRSRLTYMDPELLIFKNGYEYQRLANDMTAEAISGKPHSMRMSKWSGKAIGLKPFKGTNQDWAEHLYSLSNYMDLILDFARGAKDCHWKQTPRMLVALHKLSLKFEAENIKLKGWQIGARLMKLEDIPQEPACGSVQEFFKSYMP